MHAASPAHAHDDRLVGDSEPRLACVAAVQAPPAAAAEVPVRAHGPDMGGRDGTWPSPVLTVSPSKGAGQALGSRSEEHRRHRC